jgi:hypothetical protein
MSKKFILIIAIIVLLTPGLLAAENNKPREVVYIQPKYSSEITIDLRTQEGVARMGWGTCSPGLAADWVENTG